MQTLELRFGEVYHAHFDYVYRLVGRLAGESQPDDLTQEVFEVVHRRLPEFEGRAAMTTWLFRIAYRVVGAHIRRERRRRIFRSVLGIEKEGSYGPTYQGGLSTIEQAELRAHLNESVDRLTWKKRSVLVLHDIEDWSADQIAAELGLSINTVYSRLRSARSEMAERWTRFSKNDAEGVSL